MSEPLRAVVAVFAKAPAAGRVKTRLAAEVGAERAAALAGDLIADAWRIVSAMEGVLAVLATPDPGLDHGVGEVPQWDQGDGDLGARVERILRRGLGHAPVVVAIGADTALADAGALDAVIADAGMHASVLAPALDGGFWALAVRVCPPGLLAEVTWSAPTTGEQVRARLVTRLGSVGSGPLGYDLDTLDDVVRWVREAGAGSVEATLPAAVRRAQTWPEVIARLA